MEVQTGMSGFITGLTGTDGITAANVWSQITPAAGFVATVVLLKISYRFITNLTNNVVSLRSKKVVK